MKTILQLLPVFVLLSCSTGNAPDEPVSLTGVKAEYSNARTAYLTTESITVNGSPNQVFVYRIPENTFNSLKDEYPCSEGAVTGEYVLVNVVGKIKKLVHIEKIWDGETLKDGKIIREYEDLEDTIVLCNTYFTESAPNDALYIHDLKGSVIEVPFNENYLESESSE